MEIKINQFRFKFLAAFILLFSIGYIQSSGQQYSWSQLNDFGGSVRYGAFSFVIGNYGFIGGGNANGTTTGDMWRFDPANGSWTQKSDYPLAIQLAGNFTLNDKGYVVCGVIGASNITNKMFSYDPVNNNWVLKANFPGSPVYGGVSFAINNKGYFGIGNGGSATGPYYTAFYEYNPITDSWTQKMAFPGASRYGTYGIAINGIGYAGLGMDDDIPLVYNDWWQYDPGLNTWSQKAYFPGNTRSYPVGFMLNNFAFVGCGGTDFSMYNDFYKYNTALDSWTIIPNFSGGARWVATGFAIGDTGYIGTGFDGINYLRDFWKYSPDTTAIVTEIENSLVSIFPNPCFNQLVIKISEVNKITSIDILNLKGNVIMVVNIAENYSNFWSINLSSYAAGIYFIRLNFDNSVVIKKVVKI